MAAETVEVVGVQPLGWLTLIGSGESETDLIDGPDVSGTGVVVLVGGGGVKVAVGGRAVDVKVEGGVGGAVSVTVTRGVRLVPTTRSPAGMVGEEIGAWESEARLGGGGGGEGAGGGCG